MKKTSFVVWGGVGLCALCCLITVGVTLHVWFAVRLEGNALTTDEILACLTLIVTWVGSLVAVAAIGIGAAAIFGYAELRTMTFRKTEDQLRKIIDRLQATNDLSEATARILQESIEVEPAAAEHPVSRATRSKSGTQVDTHTESTSPKPYPSDDKEKR